MPEESKSLAERIQEVASSGEPMALWPGHDERLLRPVLAAEPQRMFGIKPAVYCICPKKEWPTDYPENYIFIGPDDWEVKLYRMMKANHQLPIPPICICLKEGFQPYIQGVFNRVVMWRERRLNDMLRKGWLGYKDWTMPEHPKVMLMTTIFSSVLQYATRDLASGFRELGCDVRISQEGAVWERATRLSQVEDMTTFLPDIVVAVDGTRPTSLADLPRHISFVGWAQDKLPRLMDPAIAKHQCPQDYQFAMWPEMQKIMTEAGHKDVMLMPAAANTDIYKPTGERLEVDIAFISNVPDTGSPERVADRVAEARRAIATGYSVNLYGLGWDRYQDLAPYSKGPVASGDALSRAYSSARLVLHVNLDTNLHQRIYEALAACSVPLVRALPSDKDDFDLTIGMDECPRYHGDDMKQVIEEALKPGNYAAYIEKGRRRVLNDHTYKARASQILSAIRARVHLLRSKSAPWNSG